MESPETFPRQVRRITHRADRRSCPTGKVGYRKVGYRTQHKALVVLETLRAKGGGERSTYRCATCGAWHLTSLLRRSAA
jgi:hypothetical protein